MINQTVDFLTEWEYRPPVLLKWLNSHESAALGRAPVTASKMQERIEGQAYVTELTHNIQIGLLIARRA